ncbi:MAG: 4-alpha-glucanotransferase [Tannerella sp.]|jgi:4-alpha-glucanotransferase|nr:4-alpha-glucanotransferase [Tannerella sp.]
MTIIFNINYITSGKAKLCITGSIPELGDSRPEQAVPMEYAGYGNWKLAIDTFAEEITYNYAIKSDSGMKHEPWSRKQFIRSDVVGVKVCYLYDFWTITPKDELFYTSAFTKNIFARIGTDKKVSSNVIPTIFKSLRLKIKVLCPYIERTQSLYITGNCEELGHWSPVKALEMSDTNFPEWEVRLNKEVVSFPLEYKFFIADKNTRENIRWETGENRIITDLPDAEDTGFVIADFPFRNDICPAWKGAGTVVPVFALRSKKSFGIGDFHDLKLLIDWAKLTGQKVIQLLPMNDTTSTYTWTDSYPYNAISTYALHPIYISLSELGKLKDKKLDLMYKQKQIALNKSKDVKYEEVLKYKLSYCRDFFNRNETQIVRNIDFQSFQVYNMEWLMPYAKFCYFRDKYKTSSFSKWENGEAIYNQLQTFKLLEKDANSTHELYFIFFLQFVLHNQFKAAADYARSQGIILKGDLPIGISRTSVEAWKDSSLFNTDMQAGAPPDMFSSTGQNWGFPTYNWEMMEKDDYAWFKNRFRNLSLYFDCLRIDHILGFFRIWEIPLDYTQGLCGHFRPALPLTEAEIEAFGFKFDKQYTKPQINVGFLDEIFGELAAEIAEKNLKKVRYNYLGLNSLCDSQRKIEDFFSDKSSLKDMYSRAAFRKLQVIKDGLFKISNEVLFIKDPYEKNKYHPRINAYNTYAYQKLSEQDKTAFQQLSDHFFYEHHNEFWKTVALKHLTPLVNSTDMLICGEDLGMIPKSVHEVMDRLHILSLELERTPKVDYEEFTSLQSVPYLSVSTTSTHDMEPLRSWWEEESHRTQRYYQSVLKQDGIAMTRLDTEVAEQIIINHLNATSMLTIIPLQDWITLSDALSRTDGMSERINIPDNPHHYWNYRMHLTIEQLMQAHELNQKIRELIDKSGR